MKHHDFALNERVWVPGVGRGRITMFERVGDPYDSSVRVTIQLVEGLIQLPIDKIQQMPPDMTDVLAVRSWLAS